MTISICNLSMVPIRSGRGDKYEMVSQLLFGETVECWEKKGNWTKVRCTLDNQIGWVYTNQIIPLTEKEVEAYQEGITYSLDISHAAAAVDHFLPLTIGATLPNFDGLKFEIAGTTYSFNGQVIAPDRIVPSTELLIKLSKKYLFAPYLKGGRSPFGVDSSGLMQVLFKLMGIAIPRDAYLQARKGELIDFFEQARVGDLAFFEDKNGHIDHVGILCEEGKILHCSGQVRVDKADHFGIYHLQKNKYTHKLRLIKRLLANDTDLLNPSKEEKEIPNKSQMQLFR